MAISRAGGTLRVQGRLKLEDKGLVDLEEFPDLPLSTYYVNMEL